MVVLYWYPKCSTCQKATKWLDQHDISYELIHIVESPPSASEILKWMEREEYPVRRFFNTSGIKYREQGLKDKVPHLSMAEAAELLSQDGMLIKRPVLISDKLLLGFKENEYTEVLGL